MSTKAEICESFGWPLGLQRLQAAAYVGVSAETFDAMVKTGAMPPAKQLTQGPRGRYAWDRRDLDSAFAALPDRGETRAAGGGAEKDDARWGDVRA